MKHLKFLQWGYLIAMLITMGAINTYLGNNLYTTGNKILSHTRETTKKCEIIAKETDRIAFYTENTPVINAELSKYTGKPREYRDRDNPKRAMSREELRERHREEFLRRQRGQAATDKEDPGSHIKLGVKLPLTLPKFLSKIDITPKSYEGDTYLAQIDTETEFYRFLEWYCCFYSEYPFSKPKNITMLVTDSNCFRNLPTNVKITAEIEFIK